MKDDLKPEEKTAMGCAGVACGPVVVLLAIIGVILLLAIGKSLS